MPEGGGNRPAHCPLIAQNHVRLRQIEPDAQGAHHQENHGQARHRNQERQQLVRTFSRNLY
jgi:hypothetical protein